MLAYVQDVYFNALKSCLSDFEDLLFHELRLVKLFKEVVEFHNVCFGLFPCFVE